MVKSIVSTVRWMGGIAVFLVVLAVISALFFGVTSTALAHKGDRHLFHLGHRNLTSAVSTLVKKGAGPALRLKFGSGPPLGVNSSQKVDRPNADQLDGKNASDIGVNGWQRVFSDSALNSNSPEIVTVSCPAGKIVVGAGYDVLGGRSGSFPDRQADVVVDGFSPNPNGASVTVEAVEEEPTSASWEVRAVAVCARAP